MIEFRPYGSSDLDAVVDLIVRTIDASYGEVYPPRAVAFFKTFHAPIDVEKRAQDGLVLLAMRDGRIVGTGSLVDGEIFAVFVDYAEQGSGVGRGIMARLESRAAAEGRTSSDLSVSLPSRRFYERLGYEMTEERERDLGDGQTLRFWKASKRLTA